MNESITVLIIEDEEAHASAITRALAGYKISMSAVVVNSIKQYLELAALINPQIILTDIHLPDGNALEALAECKVITRMPVVVMTSYGDEAVAVQAIKAGVLDYIVKSENTFREIPRMVERWMREWHNIQKRAYAEEALKESEARYRLLAENTSDMVWLMDVHCNMIYMSPSVFKTRGYTPEEIASMKLHEQMTRESHVKVMDFLTTVLNRLDDTGQTPCLSSVMELEFTRKDNTTVCTETVLTIITNNTGQPCNVLGNSRDITERKNIEQMLHLQNEELMLAKEKAEESDRLKSSFLANVSHEIRTPMNGILGFAEFLRDPWLPIEKRNKYIDIINSSSKQLLDVITDIIEISKIENNLVTVMRSTTQINDIIDSLYANFMVSKANNKHIILTSHKSLPDGRCSMVTDEVKLQQILSNLIENAIKYTDSGQVDFGYTIENNNQVVFYVKDTGVGIAPENHQVIFDRFRRVEMTQVSELKGGTGLGLAISKAYVELLGGNIWLQSELGKGSSFYVSFPFNQGYHVHEPGSDDNTVHKHLSLEHVNILITEDDDINYVYLEEILSETSASIARAIDGRQALKMFYQDSTYDLILLDIKMPFINGLEVTSEIRKTNKQIPIIAQTAYAFEDEKQKALKIGCNDYLAKPIKKDDLLRIIHKYLG